MKDNSAQRIATPLGNKTIDKEFKTFQDFWPYYVCEHSKPVTRLFHFVGTATLVPITIAAILYEPQFILLYPLCAYGLAWFSHFMIEKNRPATFKYPLKSLAGDFKMFCYMLSGKMSDEIQRCQAIRPKRRK